MSINIIRKLYFDGCQQMIGEMEKKTHSGNGTQEEVGKIRERILKNIESLVICWTSVYSGLESITLFAHRVKQDQYEKV